MTKDIDAQPLTLKEISAWATAAISIVTFTITGVIAFARVEGRCDLAEQSIQTLRDERKEYRLARDKQVESLNTRCDSLEHNFSDLTHTFSSLAERMAVMESRQNESIELLKKIDAKVNGR